MGSFFYGYVLTQVPGGRLAEMFGGKMVYGLGVLITAIFTMLSPIAARTNFTFFIIVRILEGMGEVSFFFSDFFRLCITKVGNCNVLGSDFSFNACNVG